MGGRLAGQPGDRQPPYLRARYRADPDFRARIRYACERGIPFSVYSGRVVADGEPDWLPEDRDVVAVWQAEEALRCSDCGTYEWEWEDDEFAYLPDHWTCLGCLYREQHSKQLGDSNQRLHGVKVALFRERSLHGGE